MAGKQRSLTALLHSSTLDAQKHVAKLNQEYQRHLGWLHEQLQASKSHTLELFTVSIPIEASTVGFPLGANTSQQYACGVDGLAKAHSNQDLKANKSELDDVVVAAYVGNAANSTITAEIEALLAISTAADDMKVVELRAELKKFDCAGAGRKAELIDRLREAISSKVEALRAQMAVVEHEEKAVVKEEDGEDGQAMDAEETGPSTADTKMEVDSTDTAEEVCVEPTEVPQHSEEQSYDDRKHVRSSDLGKENLVESAKEVAMEDENGGPVAMETEEGEADQSNHEQSADSAREEGGGEKEDGNATEEMDVEEMDVEGDKQSSEPLQRTSALSLSQEGGAQLESEGDAGQVTVDNGAAMGHSSLGLSRKSERSLSNAAKVSSAKKVVEEEGADSRTVSASKPTNDGVTRKNASIETCAVGIEVQQEAYKKPITSAVKAHESASASDTARLKDDLKEEHNAGQSKTLLAGAEGAGQSPSSATALVHSAKKRGLDGNDDEPPKRPKVACADTSSLREALASIKKGMTTQSKVALALTSDIGLSPTGAPNSTASPARSNAAPASAAGVPAATHVVESLTQSRPIQQQQPPAPIDPPIASTAAAAAPAEEKATDTADGDSVKKPSNLVSGLHSFTSLVKVAATSQGPAASGAGSKAAPASGVRKVVVPALRKAEEAKAAAERREAERQAERAAAREKVLQDQRKKDALAKQVKPVVGQSGIRRPLAATANMETPVSVDNANCAASGRTPTEDMELKIQRKREAIAEQKRQREQKEAQHPETAHEDNGHAVQETVRSHLQQQHEPHGRQAQDEVEEQLKEEESAGATPEAVVDAAAEEAEADADSEKSEDEDEEEDSKEEGDDDAEMEKENAEVNEAVHSDDPSKQQATNDNYDMSDRGSSSEEESDDDESAERQKKHVPAWAKGDSLKQALQAQYYGSGAADPDGIFPDVETCDLEAIFQTKKKKYMKRGSSANWHLDRPLPHEVLSYKRSVGIKPLGQRSAAPASSDA